MIKRGGLLKMHGQELSPHFYQRAVCLVSIVVIAVVSRWVFGELHRDLWQDELLLAELTRPSFFEILGSTLQTANHSPVFLLYIKGMRSLLGDGAVQLRLSSLIPTLCAAFFCFRISRRILRLDYSEALFSLAVFFLLPVTVFGMTNFRPYGVALLGITAALYFCLCFRESGRILHVVLCAGCLAIAVYGQYVYGLFGLSLLVLLGVPPYSAQRWRGIGIFLGSLTIFLSPVLVHLMQLVGRSQSLSFSAGPSLGDLLRYTLSSPLIFLFVVSRSSLFHSSEKEERAATEMIQRLTVITFFTPLVAFYLLNVVTGISLWVDRYIFWAALPFVFIFARILAAQQRAGRIAWALAVLLALVCWSQAPDTSAWRQAHRNLETELARNPSIAVVAQTGFVEASNIDFLQQDKWKNYFLSPLRYYGHRGDARILPFDMKTDARELYLLKVVEDLARGAASEVVLITAPFTYDDVGLRFIQEMLATRFAVVEQTRVSHIFIYRFRKLDTSITF